MVITFLSDLYVPPRPLINHEYKFILLFSAKAACTYSLAWYLATIGLLEKALAYSNDLHRFRQEVINRKPVISTNYESYSILKIYRDPIKRSASCFRHYIASPPLHEQVRVISGIDIKSQGISIKQYIDFLNSQNLNNSDIHCRVQYHPIERHNNKKVMINIDQEDLLRSLKKFERIFGINSDFNHNSIYLNSKPQNFIDASPDLLYNEKMYEKQALNGPWPSNIVGKKAKERLELLYEVDMINH